MKRVFGKLSGDLAGNYYPLIDMVDDFRQKLVDDHFLFKTRAKNLITSGMDNDEGRGIYFNKEKNFLTWINEESGIGSANQLRIISMQRGLYQHLNYDDLT